VKSEPPIADSEAWKMQSRHRKVQGFEVAMKEPNADQCGKCGTGIDSNRRVDFTLKDGTRVCEPCFVKGTERSPQQKRDWSN
jgi:hypothetical protein